ncbi:GNAT family N-acetyltransferase [Streptomyces purpurogeneiscleroticus]|uniref:GNAT family N-acetyltransferase n=1 Tax=Streptomyces purpurogeneiscleroticus TaxID=68259 RepID=UPI001CC0A181|nr:GNAT family N-acetyltransferase [Streptomyces purpurogeneiscleroticus]MBZ4019250.1 GNAT family N-acetyltransferase [Streptomyces purpurogeneiscleroticus]
MRNSASGPGLTVRAAAPRDLDALAALHSGARARYFRGRLPDALLDTPAERARSRETWQQALACPETTVLCAERSGAPVGVAAYRPGKDVPPGGVELSQLHVDPAHWRTGVGSALHDACVSAWHTAGHATARLQVYWHNRRARDFYARHGWRPDEGRRPAPDDTHIGLALTLAPGAR